MPVHEVFLFDSGSPGSTTTISGTVAGLSTEVLDTIPLSDFKGLKYIISYCNETEVKFKTLELLASKAGADVKDTVYAKVGDIIDIDVEFIKSGTDAELTFTNNESFDVDVSAFRVKLS